MKERKSIEDILWKMIPVPMTDTVKAGKYMVRQEINIGLAKDKILDYFVGLVPKKIVLPKGQNYIGVTYRNECVDEILARVEEER